MATDKRVTLLSIDECGARIALREALVGLGFTVTEKRCPRSTSDWVPFPVLLLSSGSGYYGRAAIELFLVRARVAGVRTMATLSKPPIGCNSWLDFVVSGPVLTSGAHDAARAELKALRDENARLRDKVWKLENTGGLLTVGGRAGDTDGAKDAPAPVALDKCECCGRRPDWD